MYVANEVLLPLFASSNRHGKIHLHFIKKKYLVCTYLWSLIYIYIYIKVLNLFYLRILTASPPPSSLEENKKKKNSLSKSPNATKKYMLGPVSEDR